MSTAVRVFLLIGAVSMFLYVFRGVRKARFRAAETFFWLLLTLVFVLLSVFPGIMDAVSGLLGVASPVNLVFLVTIFLLLVKVFAMDRKAAKTEHQLTQLVQKLAIDKLNGEKEEDKAQ